jgi:hypothetical protein
MSVHGYTAYYTSTSAVRASASALRYTAYHLRCPPPPPPSKQRRVWGGTVPSALLGPETRAASREARGTGWLQVGGTGWLGKAPTALRMRATPSRMRARIHTISPSRAERVTRCAARRCRNDTQAAPHGYEAPLHIMVAGGAERLRGAGPYHGRRRRRTATRRQSILWSQAAPNGSRGGEPCVCRAACVCVACVLRRVGR